MKISRKTGEPVMDRMFNFKVSEGMLKKIRAVARRRGIAMSEFARNVVWAALETPEEKSERVIENVELKKMQDTFPIP